MIRLAVGDAVEDAVVDKLVRKLLKTPIISNPARLGVGCFAKNW